MDVRRISPLEDLALGSAGQQHQVTWDSAIHSLRVLENLHRDSGPGHIYNHRTSASPLPPTRLNISTTLPTLSSLFPMLLFATYVLSHRLLSLHNLLQIALFLRRLHWVWVRTPTPPGAAGCRAMVKAPFMCDPTRRMLLVHCGDTT